MVVKVRFNAASASPVCGFSLLPGTHTRILLLGMSRNASSLRPGAQSVVTP